MKLTLHKFQSTGNDFILIPALDRHPELSEEQIIRLCDRRYGIGADGLILLCPSTSGHDFRMEFYNSDGSGGMMCGNGGRALISLARRIGLKPGDGSSVYRFDTPAGLRKGTVDSENGSTHHVTLHMGDLPAAEELQLSRDGRSFFINTGTIHLVLFGKEDIRQIDLVTEGRKWRYDNRFAPQGTNVDFVQFIEENTLDIRTYEKGVEDETYSCGTGVIAAAIAADMVREEKAETGRQHYLFHTKRDRLEVDFEKSSGGSLYKDIRIQGDTELVFTTTVLV